jgi:hypothetical protein
MKKVVFAVMVAGVLTLGGGIISTPTAVHANGISDILEIQRERTEQKAPIVEKKVELKKDSKETAIKDESSKKDSSYTPLIAVRTRGISDVLEIMKEWSMNK